MTSEELRQRILRIDGNRCRECHKQSDRLEIDHIIPQYKGGLDGIQNLRTLCHECHKKRHDTDRFVNRLCWGFLEAMLDNFKQKSIEQFPELEGKI